jgi:hypothetical protein
MRRIEADSAGVTGNDGPERSARAIAALRSRLAVARLREPDVDGVYILYHDYERILFTTLCLRYGLTTFRRPRARATSVCVSAPRSFLDTILWPMFQALSDGLYSHLDDATARVLNAAFPETFVLVPDDSNGIVPQKGTTDGR